ncbi:MAG: hypothetical protein V3T70_10185, partial [Phycisphaerae bacterium]
IEFENDGSSDWYTLIIARTVPGAELEPETRRIWVILDGRTGLARIRQAVTEEQIEELAMRPDLDKLQPPETPLDELVLSSSDAMRSMMGDISNLSALAGGGDAAPPHGDAQELEEALEASKSDAVRDAIENSPMSEEDDDEEEAEESGARGR